MEKMGLLEEVMKAEQEYYWRIKAIADLMRDFTGTIRDEIEKEFKLTKQYALEPKRNGSTIVGKNPSYGEKRSLPQPGTLIVREYTYQRPWPERTKPNGTKQKVYFETFRFVVVDTPSKLIRLGDNEGGIHLSVSGAATAATGVPTDGWRFFKIGLKKKRGNL